MIRERWREAAVATVDLGDDAYLAEPKYVRIAADAAVAVALHHLRAEFASVDAWASAGMVDVLLRELGQ